MLKGAFGDAVVEHSKAIEIKGTLLRMKVDVLPAFRFSQVYSCNANEYFSNNGVAFWVDNRRVVNWPQHHFENGVLKNQATNEHFKPAIRMIKNARRVATERGLMADGIAPCPFLQGLLWNVPDEFFVADLSTTYVGVISWLSNNQAGHPWFKCQTALILCLASVRTNG